MPDTFTPNIQLDDQTIGGNNNTWGNILNTNQNTIDAKFGTLTGISTTGGATTLTATQEIVAAINITGALASNATINFSGRGGFWIISNNTTGAFTVTFKVTGQTGVTLGQGQTVFVYCNGTDIFLANTPSSLIPFLSQMLALPSGTTTLAASQSGMYVANNSGASRTANLPAPGAALNFAFFNGGGASQLTINTNGGSFIFLDGTSAANVTLGPNQVLIVECDGTNWIVLASNFASRGLAPVGTVVDFAGANAPPQWLLCAGQAVSRTTYSVLFGVLSTVYGSGDGVTTFNLPDCRGRFIAGKDNMNGSAANRLTNQPNGIDGSTLGAVGGEQSHTLASGEMPTHTHTASVTDPGHLHNMLYSVSSISFGTGGNGNPVLSLGGGTSNANTASSTTGISVTNANTGGGGAHNTVPPAIIMNKIIFAGV